MSSQQPYDDPLKEQLNDLPLPDMEQSWQKMELLLEDEDDRRRIIPPIFLRGCAGFGLLLLLVAAWFLFRPDRLWNREDTRTSQQKEQTLPKQDTERPQPPGRTTSSGANQPPDAGTMPAGPDQTHDHTSSTQGQTLSDSTINNPEGTQTNRDRTNEQRQATRLPAQTGTVGSHGNATRKTPRGNSNRKAGNTALSKKAKDSREAGSPNSNTKGNKLNTGGRDTASATRDEPSATTGTPTGAKLPAKKDSTAAARADSLKAKATASLDSAKQTVDKPKEKAKPRYWVSAGIGIQQQIPFAGQTTTPYNYYGRKGSLADYIPSVYARLHREQKWFVQGEFRYGAPQSTREINYSTRTRFDSSIGAQRTSRLRVRKTYYHQVPLSFNYYVRPGWSVGGGLMYSRFRGAIAESEQFIRRGAAQDSLVGKEIVQVKPKGDSTSAFTQSQVHVLFQTEYEWRRFSLGARYTRGLQPFLIYNDPAGVRREEINQSLQIFLRFRLWKKD